SISGTSCLVSDPERRGLLGSIIERLVSLEAAQRRPWNKAEIELLDEIVPPLQESGIIEVDGQQQVAGAGYSAPLLRKALQEARIAIVGHGVLGRAVRALLTDMPCGPITVIESSSVARANVKGTGPLGGASRPSADATVAEQSLSRPRDAAQWTEAVGGQDWV